MKALSIRQPWAWAILHAGKRIENRDWKGCSYRGPLLIHASLWGSTKPQREEALEDARFVTTIGRRTGHIGVDPIKFGTIMEHRGGIVGVANVVDVVRGTLSGHRLKDGECTGCGWKTLTLKEETDLLLGGRELPMVPECSAKDHWFFGPLGLVLDDVRPLPFVPLKGALGLFEVPDAVVAKALEAAPRAPEQR